MELFIVNEISAQQPYILKRDGAYSILYVLTGIIVSCYFFPFGINPLPAGFNTKIMLAIVAFPTISFQIIQSKQITLNKELLPAVLLAALFSLVGYISCDINNSNDYAYANYFVSFGTWILAAYTVCYLLKKIHGYIDFELIIRYLAIVCVGQCIIAIAIDNHMPLKAFVDAHILQDAVASVDFLNEVERLYGIGAALDPAGTRFSAVLIGIAAVIVQNVRGYQFNRKAIFWYWIAFILLSIMGNMMSRTTTVGMLMGLSYILLGIKISKAEISTRILHVIGMFFLVCSLLFLLAAYFYNTQEEVQSQIRFAFEGFFNWMEKGEWRTDSTDKLNSEMWIWPSDLKTWLIGKADFSFGGTGTDIGYCRFIFYSGLIGLFLFSIYFISNAIACARKFPAYTYFFVFLLILGFVVWLKIPTDLFMMYALFYCMGTEERSII